MNAFAKAVAKLDGPAAAGRELKRSTQAILNYMNGRTLPAELCPTIERLTGVCCEELRPDVEWHVLRNGRMNR